MLPSASHVLCRVVRIDEAGGGDPCDIDLPSASPDGRLEFDVLEHDIEALVPVDPLEAGERLARYLDPVVLTPVEEDGRVQYAYAITLRYDPATLAGGRVIDKSGCGGAEGTFSESFVART